MVGAGSSSFPHERMWFSNYGSRIDVYGWGENVDTTTAEQSRSAVNLYTQALAEHLVPRQLLLGQRL